MMTKRLFVIILMGLFLISGCRPNTTEEPTLELVLTGLQQPNEKTFFRTFVRLFEAEHGISVNLSYVLPDDMMTYIETSKTEGKNIDVIMIDTARMSNYFDQDLMVDLQWLNQEVDRTFTQSFDQYTHRSEVRYFAPVSLDVYLTLYNKSALPFIPNGVETIGNDQEEITEITKISWQQLSTWAKNIEVATGSPRFGFPYGQNSSQLIYPITGIGLAMGDHSLPSFNDAGAKTAWAYLFDLKQNNALAFGPTFASVNQPTELLNSNDLWISFGHMGPLGSTFIANPNKYVLGPVPYDETTLQSGSTAGAWAYGMLKTAKHPTAGKAWIKFITDPEINYLYCSGLGGVISPLYEVNDHLTSSTVDQIMATGIRMMNNHMDIVVVDTTRYTVWNEVKLLYIDLYLQLLDGVTIDDNVLNTYQSQLTELRKA